MTREFKANLHGTMYAVVLVLEATQMRCYLNWRGGYGGGSRLEFVPLTTDLPAVFKSAPGYVLADALAEAGLDDGMADVVRNAA